MSLLGIRRTAVGFVCLAAAAAAAHAAAPDAWASHEAEVVAKCMQASGLQHAKLLGSLIEYDDSVGYTAAFVTGNYPQPHMKNKQGKSLCLFDKRNRTAHAMPADDIR